MTCNADFSRVCAVTSRGRTGSKRCRSRLARRLLDIARPFVRSREEVAKLIDLLPDRPSCFTTSQNTAITRIATRKWFSDAKAGSNRYRRKREGSRLNQRPASTHPRCQHCPNCLSEPTLSVSGLSCRPSRLPPLHAVVEASWISVRVSRRWFCRSALRPIATRRPRCSVAGQALYESASERSHDTWCFLNTTTLRAKGEVDAI